ncbi:MAG TPA: hypothetical protein VLH39_04795 [Magnetospirillaceae bacterium]|nr:hypothetical protein [Magnetospirillaceae bacterium]
MRRHRLALIAAACLLFPSFTPFSVSAQAHPAAAFDFSASVESLAEAAQTGAALPVGRYVLLTGTVRTLTAERAEPFRMRVEVAAGLWIGTSRVVLRTVEVNFRGEEYRDRADRESPSFLRTGNIVLVVAAVSGVRTGPDGSGTAVLEGVHIRPLDKL